jgi:diketogulonate reductase-like aldo/keto reductase
VRQSFERSLEHLGTDYLDSYVLHGPSQRYGLGASDWEVWRAMERLEKEGRARVLGVSNVDLAQLEALVAGAKVRPTFVQNRCYARRGWDREVRAFCQAQRIVYQGFSLLTANPEVLGHPEVRRLAAAKAITPAQLVFAYCVAIGMLPLTGTSSDPHMREDLEAIDLALDPNEIAVLDRASARA